MSYTCQYRTYYARNIFIVYFNVQETSVAEWSTAGQPYHGDGLQQPVHTFQAIHDTNNCLEGFSNLIRLESLDQINAAEHSTTTIGLTNDVNPTNQVSDAYNPEDLLQNVPDESQSSTAQFSCKETGCSKSYTTISGLNNHIKK